MIPFSYQTETEIIDAVFFQTGIVADSHGRVFHGMKGIMEMSRRIRVVGSCYRGMDDVLVQMMAMCPVNIVPGEKQYPRMFVDEEQGRRHFVFMSSDGHGFAIEEGDSEKNIYLYEEWDVIKPIAHFETWDSYLEAILRHALEEAKKSK